MAFSIVFFFFFIKCCLPSSWGMPAATCLPRLDLLLIHMDSHLIWLIKDNWNNVYEDNKIIPLWILYFVSLVIEYKPPCLPLATSLRRNLRPFLRTIGLWERRLKMFGLLFNHKCVWLRNTGFTSNRTNTPFTFLRKNNSAEMFHVSRHLDLL